MRNLIPLLAFVVPGAVSAQLASVSTGSRVRVAAPSVQRRVLVGTLMESIADSVIVAVPARGTRRDSAGLVERKAIPTTLVEGLAVSEGRTRGAGARRGAKIAVLGVAGLTLVSAMMDRNEGTEDYSYSTDPGLGIIGAAVLGGLAAAGGAVVGRIVRAEQWRCVFPPESARQKNWCRFARPNPTVEAR